MNNPMNAQLRKYRELGYQTTGKTFKSWEREAANAAAKSLRVNGNKAVVVSKKEVWNFRDSQKSETYLIILELPTLETIEARKQAHAQRQIEIHQSELKRVAANFSIDDIKFMLSTKEG